MASLSECPGGGRRQGWLGAGRRSPPPRDRRRAPSSGAPREELPRAARGSRDGGDGGSRVVGLRSETQDPAVGTSPLPAPARSARRLPTPRSPRLGLSWPPPAPARLPWPGRKPKSRSRCERLPSRGPRPAACVRVCRALAPCLAHA